MRAVLPILSHYIKVSLIELINENALILATKFSTVPLNLFFNCSCCECLLTIVSDAAHTQTWKK